MATHKPTVAITGANGFLGSALVDYFSAKGWHIIALVRNPSQYSDTKAVRYVAYDLRQPLNEQAITPQVDYLIHTAYIPSNTQNPDAFEANVQAAKRLIEASRKYKLSKTVFMSTMSAHAGAESVYGKQKLAIEKLFDSSRDVVLRSGLIIGSGGIVKNMAQFMKSKHVAPLIGGGKQPLQIIALADLLTVIEHALTLSIHGTLTVANPTVYTYKEFYQALANRLGTKVVFIPVPFFALLGVLRLVAALHLPLAVSTDNALGLKHLIAVDNQKDMHAVQVAARPLPAALEAVSF